MPVNVQGAGENGETLESGCFFFVVFCLFLFFSISFILLMCASLERVFVLMEEEGHVGAVLGMESSRTWDRGWTLVTGEEQGSCDRSRHWREV